MLWGGAVPCMNEWSCCESNAYNNKKKTWARSEYANAQFPRGTDSVGCLIISYDFNPWYNQYARILVRSYIVPFEECHFNPHGFMTASRQHLYVFSLKPKIIDYPPRSQTLPAPFPCMTYKTHAYICIYICPLRPGRATAPFRRTYTDTWIYRCMYTHVS